MDKLYFVDTLHTESLLINNHRKGAIFYLTRCHGHPSGIAKVLVRDRCYHTECSVQKIVYF